MLLLLTCFFLTICLVGVPFYFMMQFFIYFLAKKLANLDKKLIYVLSFAMSALIYSVVPVIIFENVKILLLFLMLGLMISVSFYSILWCFLRTFEKVFPNRSDLEAHSAPNFLISFTITAPIFSFIFSISTIVFYGFITSSGYDHDHKNGACLCQKIVNSNVKIPVSSC